jgi:hypothetical protein
MDEQEEPFGWWGWHWQPPVPMSIMQIVEAGSADTGIVALLWAMMARRASILVAAEPPMAGKTTTLTALLDLMPPDTRRIYLRGHYETFEFVSQPGIVPAQTYVLANEMSDHLAVYLWGSRVYKMFELIEKGYAIGSTMHAETVDDVMAILDSDPLNVPARWIARLTLVVNLYISSTYSRAMRRFNTVHMLIPDEGPVPGVQDVTLTPASRVPESPALNPSLIAGVRPVLLSRWDRGTDTFEHRFEQPEIMRRLALWACVTPEEWRADLARRKQHLDKMRAEGVRGISATKKALDGLKL